MLEITFRDQRDTFLPGQEINGHLKLRLTSKTHVSSIVICFSGVGVIKKDGKHNKDDFKQEIYFDHVTHIFDSEGEDKVKKMDIGTYSFPFKYMLPQKIPASFESPDGFIRYSVTTYMDTASLGLQTAVAFFTVNAILDLNKIPKSAEASTGWSQQDVCLCCCKCSRVSAVMNIPRRGYVPGENILISAEINNFKNKAISYVKAELVQVVKYNHNEGPRKMKRVVAEVLRGSVMPYESQVWLGEPLQIPAVAASRLAHCTLMDIWYKLYLHVCSSGSEGGETLKLVKVPITIGTVPLRQQVQDLEEGTGEPLLPGTNLPSPGTEPCIFGPYSITDEYAQNQVQISFTPLYVTYSAKGNSGLETGTWKEL